MVLAGVVASAAAAHETGHYSFGEPGTAAEVTRTVEVTADDRDGMRFVMDLNAVRQGEVIRFVVTNAGAVDHEFSIGDTAAQQAHAMAMADEMDIRHEHDPTAIRVVPGATRELIWQFDRPIRGTLVFACQIPGHYAGGMTHRAAFETAGTVQPPGGG
ncbi:MAG: hypothetical protein ACJ8H8_15650 [Geminicoccaceae bacterium]